MDPLLYSTTSQKFRYCTTREKDFNSRDCQLFNALVCTINLDKVYLPIEITICFCFLNAGILMFSLMCYRLSDKPAFQPPP